MSYDLTNHPEDAPPPLPGISARTLHRLIRGSLIAGAAVTLGLAVWWLVHFYTNLVWFHLLGFGDVFFEIALVKAFLFCLGAGAASLILLMNFSQALKLSWGPNIAAGDRGHLPPAPDADRRWHGAGAADSLAHIRNGDGQPVGVGLPAARPGTL